MATSLPAGLVPGTYAIDGSHSTASFTVRHAGIAKVRGTIGITSGTVTIGDDRRTIEPGHEGGFQYEAAEVARCVAAGRTESGTMSWADTLAVLETMDEVRRQLGVVYPGE